MSGMQNIRHRKLFLSPSSQYRAETNSSLKMRGPKFRTELGLHLDNSFMASHSIFTTLESILV